jgi:hypothetical protein
MTSLSAFKESLREKKPRTEYSYLLQALWWDAQDNWEKAHDIAQNILSNDGSWIHAYLHRKEGDQFNADYWYRRAGRNRFEGSFEDEWQEMVTHFLA